MLFSKGSHRHEALVYSAPDEATLRVHHAALVKGRALVARPDGWGRHHLGYANRFCAIGAVRYAMRGNVHYAVGLAETLLRAGAPHGRVEGMNDTSRTVDPVLALYDDAIAACEKRLAKFDRAHAREAAKLAQATHASTDTDLAMAGD